MGTPYPETALLPKQGLQPQPQSPKAVSSDDPLILTDIYQDDVNIATWKRRLVTTYTGPATQWLPHECVDRSRLGGKHGGLPDEQSGLMKSPEDIRQMACGDVAILKGELWAGNENAGLVHRSPGVREGQKRLVLTLDFQ